MKIVIRRDFVPTLSLSARERALAALRGGLTMRRHWGSGRRDFVHTLLIRRFLATRKPAEVLWKSVTSEL